MHICIYVWICICICICIWMCMLLLLLLLPCIRVYMYMVCIPLCRVVGGIEGLHILYCKGVVSRAIGCCLHTMVYPRRGLYGPTAAKERLTRIQGRIKTLYKAINTPTRISNFKLSMFVPDVDSPWAGTDVSLNCKGAECKHLLPIIAQISSELAEEGNAYNRIEYNII